MSGKCSKLRQAVLYIERNPNLVMTARCSRQGASPATNNLLPGDNAQDEPHLATIA